MRTSALLCAVLLLLVPTAFSQAVTETTQYFWVWEDSPVFVPCANQGEGEIVLLNGTLHDLYHVTVNGNCVTVKSHSQPQAMKGEGQVTGDSYNGVGVTQDLFHARNVMFPFTYTYVNRFLIISPKGDSYTVRTTQHITVNANGQTTVEFVKFDSECK